MKVLFTTTFLLAMMVLMLTPGQSYAQSDTLTVLANGQTLDQIIMGDVTNGVQNHKAYKLTETDLTYLVDATITVSQSVSIIGVPDASTGRLPCIQSDVLQSGALTGIQFQFSGANTTVILKNLYLLGVAPNNAVSTSAGQGIQVSADSINLIVDNCVFDDFTQFDIGYNASWDKFKLTNCKFRNGIELATAYYVPEVLRSEWPGTLPTDSVVIDYNTMLCVASGPVMAAGYIKYFEFLHNDIIDGVKAPVWTERATNAKIDNNIFYNTYAVSVNETEYYGFWDEKGSSLRIPAVFNYITLDSATAGFFTGKTFATSQDSAAAEAARKIEIKNNAYFWSSDLLSLYKTINDTTKVVGTNSYADSIYTPVFMNSSTTAMFGNNLYPNFTQSGNQNSDPGFGAGIGSVMGSTTTGDGNGLLAYILAVRSGTGTTQFYAYQRANGGAKVPTWPLPESSDLKYSATLTSTDNLPVGDPYWFTGKITGVPKTELQVPTKFALYPAYPNPFNPSTNIKFSLDKSGVVSLKIYNVMGQLVKTIVNNEYKEQGSYNYQIFMNNLSSGVYFYNLTQGSQSISMKMLLLK